MILYMHGLRSNATTVKASLVEDMQCYVIDYEKHDYAGTELFYENVIKNNDVEMIVGHSLGGYWALKLGNKYQIPVVLVNPSLFPRVTLGYPPCTVEDTVNKSHRFLYLEMDDEVLDSEKTYNFLYGTTSILKVEGGHHRVEHLDKLKDYINNCLNYTIVG